MPVASTNSTSPPAPVTARPVATPGTAVRMADSWKNFCRPSASRTGSTEIVLGRGVDGDRHRSVPLPSRDLGCGLAQHGAELTLEVSHPGLAGVVGDQQA